MLYGAVLGFGNMGRQLTLHINSDAHYGAQVVVVSDLVESNLRDAREGFGLRVIDDAKDLEGQGLDFVLVSSTTGSHAEQVIAAARAGCHVFCEKPIALNLHDAEQMVLETESRELVTVVNYITRFNEGYQYLRRLVESGELGTILSIIHHRLRGFGLYESGARHPAVLKPEESGGWTVHHACHDTDLVLWLGGSIASVYGHTVSTVREGVDRFPERSNPSQAPDMHEAGISTGSDSDRGYDAHSEELVSALLHLHGGAIAHIEDSVCGLREHYTRIIGSKASVVLTGENEHSVCRLKREGSDREERVPVEDRKRAGGALGHFFECIRSGARSPVDLRSAGESLAVALAIRRSAREGRPMVPEALFQ